jgi:serine/threonine protein kinase
LELNALDNRVVLPVSTVLDGSYRITRVLRLGRFGITYEARDINLGTRVAIKEYYPYDYVGRQPTMRVRPKSDQHKQTFEQGLSNFLDGARALAGFDHQSIVHVMRVFEANSTTYMVMRFEAGLSMESSLARLGRLPTQAELDSVTSPLLDALQVMHAANFLHRKISPDNIIIRLDGIPVLVDFGALSVVKAGYSPHEQYSSNGSRQGPWSDLHAFGGTLYRAVTGVPPKEALLRLEKDTMPSAIQAAKGKYRPDFLAAIDTCLKVKHAERPQSVAQLRATLLPQAAGSVPARIFISYRRDDSAGYAGRVHDRLEREFGRDLLFMDVDTVPLAADFSVMLSEAVAKCGILIAVIGANWLHARDESGQRRLDNPSDYVRIEIAAALKRDIPIIPIFLEGARMPQAEHLPEDLSGLAVRNGLDVRHPTFHTDVDKLIEFLKQRLSHDLRCDGRT